MQITKGSNQNTVYWSYDNKYVSSQVNGKDLKYCTSGSELFNWNRMQVVLLCRRHAN